MQANKNLHHNPKGPPSLFHEVPAPVVEVQKYTSFKDLNIERSPMAASFRHIPGGWRNYVLYARSSSQDGNEDMVKFVKAFDALTPKERRTVMPEQVCDLAGVKPHEAIGAITAQLWLAKSNEGMQIAAIAHPNVIKSMTYLASIPTPETHNDRVLHLRTLGQLPDKKGASMTVNVNTHQTTQSLNLPHGSGTPLRSFKDDILEMEQITDGDMDNVIEMPLQPVEAEEDV